LSFIAWASYRIGYSAPAGNDLARGLAFGDRVLHNLSVRSKQTLKSGATRATQTKRRQPARPRLRTAQPIGPTGSATRDRLVEAALTTLRTRGFPGTTARAIARTGKLNQALIFYHFGSLDRLLLAALDLTSARRLARYQSALADVTSITDAIDVMSRLYTEDVEVGHVGAVQEMVAGGSSVPGLRPEVGARMEPWVRFAESVIARLVKGTFLEGVLPTGHFAYAAVALYFGIETLTHLDGDRSRAEALFDTGKQLAPIADAMLTSATWTGDKP
jgi:AcrR family transcriptional regulator